MAQQSKKIFISIGVGFILLVLTRVITITPRLANGAAAWCAYPVILVQDTIVTPMQKRQFDRASLQELTEALRAYKQQIATLLAENIELKAQQAELQETEPIKSFSQRYKTKHAKLAQIILRQFAQDGHYMLLNKGSRAGILEDMVAVYDNCLLGRVVEVHPHYCKILLITDQLSKVPAFCAKTGTHGIHEGAQSLTESRLEYVSHLQTLEVGDMLLTSGDGLVYPRGFALGKIKDFNLNALGLTYIVTVEPLLDFQEIRHCYIVPQGTEYLAEDLLDTD